MDEFSSGSYDQFAEAYDRLVPECERSCIETLTSIAGQGSALELGVGTGRIAIPLSRAGVRVVGIDDSVKMLDRLRCKEGANKLALVVGNFVDIPVEGQFDLIYVTYGTFGCLKTQEEQIQCMCNVRKRLTERGAFVVEMPVPGEWIFLENWSLLTTSVNSDSVVQIFVRADLVRQVAQRQAIEIQEKRTKLYPQEVRFAWPSELDLIARLAGLRLSQRWGGWGGERFTSQSKWHVTVYKPML